ncbi:MAG: HU family DNA-binding protein [Paludibacteraceae bacterium]|nr:HU family DNA-binding protein [Paludibacteraceae bacterium]
MKDDKIGIGQLKSLLAKKAKISERQAAQFVEALFQQISVGLQQDGQVKISGLGTFKIQWNEPRKSVDVNTGNEIVIDGYNKVTFSPEASIKTLVNEPYANLEPQIIDENGNPIDQPKNDPLQKLSDEADNIMLLIADLKKMDNQQNTNEQQEEPKQEEPKQEEPKQEEPKQEEPKQEEPKQ